MKGTLLVTIRVKYDAKNKESLKEMKKEILEEISPSDGYYDCYSGNGITCYRYEFDKIVKITTPKKNRRIK